MNGSVYVGQKALSLTEYEKMAPISGVVLWVDDENCYEAGDETGTVIEQDCPYASQQMADNLLATLQGYSYQGLEANGAKVSPIAELGDGVTVNGLYTQLAYQNIRFSTGEVMDVAAPGNDETLHEYKTEGETTKHFAHQIAETRSTISKTAKEIRLEVENELKGLSSSFTVQLDSITGRVNGLDRKYTELSVTLDGVTIKDPSGTTLIKGSSVQTDTLYVRAANITGTLSADQINLTGSISFSDLSSSVQNDINDAYSMAEDAQSAAADAADTVDGWTYRGTTYIDGKRIMTGTVSASTLEGGEVLLLDSSGYEAGSFTLDGASSTSGRKILITSNALELDAVNGDIYLGLYGGSSGYVQISDGEVTIGRCNLQPNLDNRYDCGTNGHRWSAVYAASSSIITSDRNKKNSITYDMSAYDALFDRLRPTPYKYNDGTSDRTHTGLISQDVEQALEDCGLTTQDFAGFVKGVNADGGETYSLRYEEFIALCIDQIKRLKRRVDVLEGYT